MMYCMKKNIYIFTALFIILKFAYSHKVLRTQNVTTDRVKRQLISLSKADDKSKLFLYSLIGVLPALKYDSPFNTAPDYCEINIKELHFSHSILISPQDFEQFHYPNDVGDIRVIQNANLFLSCPGDGNRLANYSSYQFATITCVGKKIFTDPHGKRVDFDTTRYVCLRSPESKIRLSEKKSRFPSDKLYEIGFYVGKDEKFLKLMLINYDTVHNSTDYVISDISKWLAGGQKPPPNRRFDQSYYCPDFQMDSAYDTDVQKTSFKNQLECQRDGKCNYFDISKEKYLDRGHLTPKSSFVYTAAGVATFKYLNTAPQWKVIKYQNWLLIEKHIVTMATTLKEDLRTITGVLYPLYHKDLSDRNKVKFVHLYFAENKRAIQVPMFFYKLVFLVEGRRGVVYVTVNNPDMSLDVISLYKVCQNPMFKIEGGKSPSQWSPTHRDKGYSYICEVPDFLEFNGLDFNDTILESVKDLLFIPDGSDPITTSLAIFPTTIEPWRIKDELK